MSSQIQDIERRKAIREYIIEHDGCTKTQVIDYMKGKSALATTHNIIKDMIKNGTVIVKPDKKNRQMHHLHINDNFSILDREITKIKKIMDLMDEPIRRLLKVRPSKSDKTLSEKLEDPNKKLTNFNDMYNHFIYPYEESISLTIRILSVRISETILSEKDAQSLYTRLMSLSNRLTRQIFYIDKEKEYLDFCAWELETFSLSTTKAFAQKNDIDIEIRKNIIHYIRNFEQKFLYR